MSLAKQIEQATSNVQYREQVVDKTIEDITKYIDKLDAKLLEQKYIIEEISEAENVENALEGFEK